jgi:hypothetical protein
MVRGQVEFDATTRTPLRNARHRQRDYRTPAGEERLRLVVEMSPTAC